MQQPSFVILTLLLPPLLVFCVELAGGFGIRGFLNSLAAWVPLCVALLVTGVVLALARLRSRTRQNSRRRLL